MDFIGGEDDGGRRISSVALSWQEMDREEVSIVRGTDLVAAHVPRKRVVIEDAGDGVGKHQRGSKETLC